MAQARRKKPGELIRLISRLCFLFAIFSTTLPAAELRVKPSDLQLVAAKNIMNVSEFAEIRKEAESRGLRVWALGGAASSYVDHAKHELLGPNYSPRLTWEFNNILLPEQDVDLVLTRANGTAETAQEVESFLEWVRKRYPYTADGRSRWEAIGLKTTSQNGRKMAIGTDPDFLRQHNDTLSLGMLEITQPPANENPFRNLGNKTDFVRDIAQSEFHFLYNPSHAQTARFQKGMNPPILSVVRALEKATRYNLDVDAESVRVMKQIVTQWDPKTVQVDSYVYNYLHGRGKRVFTHANDLEEAMKLVESVGLKEKLLKLPGVDTSVAESLGWWLNRSPLPTQAQAGKLTGRTAGSLGIHKAYHWTSHANHRLMTWNYNGKPRLFQSREGISGETAVLGKGFYTFANDPANKKHRNTKAADQFVEFDVDPAAREGVDFTYDKATETVVWKSSEHLKVAHQKPAYPNSLKCSTAFAGLSQPAGNNAANVAASQTTPAHIILMNMPAPLPAWKAIPKWMNRNRLKTVIGGIFAYQVGKELVNEMSDLSKAVQADSRAPGPTNSGNGTKNQAAPAPAGEDFAKNFDCLQKLQFGPAAECGQELSTQGKVLAVLLSKMDGAEKAADRATIDWLHGVTDDRYQACVLRLAVFPRDPYVPLSFYLSQCDGLQRSLDLPTELLKPAKNKGLKLNHFEFALFARAEPQAARKCAEAFPAGTDMLEGSRLSDCLSLPAESLAKLKPYLDEVKQTHGEVPLTVNKEMIDMGAGDSACYLALGDFTRDTKLITETCAKENPLPETLLLLRLAIEKSQDKDWTRRGDEIKKFLETYRTSESIACAKSFMSIYDIGPLSKEPLNFCGVAEIADVNKILLGVLASYKNHGWTLSMSDLERLKSIKTEISRQCLQKVIDSNGFYPLHEKTIAACAAMTREENLGYFANALQYAVNNRQGAQDFTGVTANNNTDSLKCREIMAARGHNSFGGIAKAFCDHDQVAGTNKILPNILAFYANNRSELKPEYADEFKLYSTDLARDCGLAIVGTNKWYPLYKNFAKACSEMTKKENLPYLARAFQYVANNGQSVEDITGVTANGNTDSLKCREIMAPYGTNPFSSYVKAFCDHDKVTETNKFLPNLLSFLGNNRMSLQPESAPVMQLYATDLARECGQTLMNQGKNPLYEKFAKSCASMAGKENIRYLAYALQTAANNRQSFEDISAVTANSNLDSLKCQELMAGNGFNAFGSTVAAYCDQADAKGTYELLQYLLPVYQNNRWTLPPASTLKEYKTTGSRECVKQLLNQSIRPFGEKSGADCLAK